MTFELFSNKLPKTTANFRAYCTGEKGGNKNYKNNTFTKVIEYFMMQAGDTTTKDGKGSDSIYGEKFDDEGTWFPHSHRGCLSTANWNGKNTNSS